MLYQSIIQFLILTKAIMVTNSKVSLALKILPSSWKNWTCPPKLLLKLSPKLFSLISPDSLGWPKNPFVNTKTKIFMIAFKLGPRMWFGNPVILFITRAALVKLFIFSRRDENVVPIWKCTSKPRKLSWKNVRILMSSLKWENVAMLDLVISKWVKCTYVYLVGNIWSTALL